MEALNIFVLTLNVGVVAAGAWFAFKGRDYVCEFIQDTLTTEVRRQDDRLRKRYDSPPGNEPEEARNGQETGIIGQPVRRG